MQSRNAPKTPTTAKRAAANPAPESVGTDFRYAVEFSKNGRTPATTSQTVLGATLETLPGPVRSVKPARPDPRRLTRRIQVWCSGTCGIVAPRPGGPWRNDSRKVTDLVSTVSNRLRRRKVRLSATVAQRAGGMGHRRPTTWGRRTRLGTPAAAGHLVGTPSPSPDLCRGSSHRSDRPDPIRR